MKKLCVLIAVLIISGFLISIVIRDTYSKYSSSGELGISGNSGTWAIELNGQDITNDEGITQSFLIENLNYDSSEYVAANKIAPGISGNFQIEINPNDTDVAIKFDVTLDLTNLDETGRMYLTSVKKLVNGVEEVDGIIQTDETTYTGTISLDSIDNEDEIIIQAEFQWPNDSSGANDIADTVLGTDTVNTSVSIPVTVNVTQYMGETITEYIEV